MPVGDSGYQRWASFLERWRAGQPADPGGLPALDEEDYPADAWLRLVTRLVDTLGQRLQAWLDALLRAMAAAQDEFEVARALTQARTGLVSIRAVAGHAGLPEELSRLLSEHVDKQIRSAQQAMEEGIEAARRAGVDDRVVQVRLRTLRDNPIDGPGGSTPASGTGWTSPPTRSARRIIVDPPVRPS